LFDKSCLPRIFFIKIWPAANDFHETSSSESFWDVLDLKFLILSTNSLVVKLIEEKRLKEVLLLT